MAAATQTKTITRVTAPTRAYDHVYDPTYMVASSSDFSRAKARAQVDGSRLVPVPDAENMFSALVHVPRGTVTLKESGMIPSDMPTEFASKQQQQLQLTAKHRAACDPTGRDYTLKYFSRARVDYAPGIQNNTLLRLAREAPPPPQPKVEEAATRTIAIQTDYRYAHVCLHI